MKAPVSRCKAVCAHPTGRVASIPLRRAETRRWPPCGRCWANAPSNPAFPSVADGRRAKEGRPRMPDLKARRASRINAGVTSDARQVTSARSANRFKGFRGFPAGLLTGVCFRRKTGRWRLISQKHSRPNGLGRRLSKIRRCKRHFEYRKQRPAGPADGAGYQAKN